MERSEFLRKVILMDVVTEYIRSASRKEVGENSRKVIIMTHIQITYKIKLMINRDRHR